MNNSSEVNWDPSIWQDINDAVVKEIVKARVAQQDISGDSLRQVSDGICQ